MTKRTARILFSVAAVSFTAYFAYAWRFFYLRPEFYFSSNIDPAKQQSLIEYFERHGGVPREPFRMKSAAKHFINPFGHERNIMCLAVSKDPRGEWILYVYWFSSKWDFTWDADGRIQLLNAGANPVPW